MKQTMKRPSLLRLYKNQPIAIYNIVQNGGYFYKGTYYKVKCFPNRFWDEDTAEILIRYLILEKLEWTREDICSKISCNFFAEHGLRMVLKIFNGSAFNVIQDCFPEMKIKAWELKCCPNSYWKEPENCKDFLLWVIEKEGYSENIDEFCAKVTFKTLYKYSGGKSAFYIGGLYQLIDYTFPGKYKPWDLKRIVKIDDDMIIRATKWLIEEKLKWSFEDVCNNITAQIFYDYGIGTILSHGCKHSPIVALEKAYPGKYTKQMLRKGMNHPFRGKKV